MPTPRLTWYTLAMMNTPWSRLLAALSLVATQAACGAERAPAPEPPAAEEAPPEKDPPEKDPPETDPPEENPRAEERESAESEEPDWITEAREKLAETRQKERERYSDALRQKAQSLAETEFESIAEGVEAALASEHRFPKHAERDPHRNAAETMAFFELEPDMKVLEYGPGGGWYTEVLAPVLAPEGTLLVTVPDLEREDASAYDAYSAERLEVVTERSPALFGNVQRVTYNPAEPDLDLSGEVDAVLMIRGMHGRAADGTLDAWLTTFYDALEAGGVFGVVQHRAEPGADPEESAPRGYLPEDWVIETVEAAGFELEERSEINANPKDTKDYEEGVWTLPPTLRLGDENRERYEAIGESDRMTLRFVKPEA